MIVNSADAEYTGDNDFFSLAGRLALVGGAAYAVSKTGETYSGRPDFMRSKRSDKFKTNLAEVIKSGVATQKTETVRGGGFFKSEFFNNASGKKGLNYLKHNQNIGDLLSGGKDGRSKELGSEIQRFMDRISQHTGKSPTVTYRLGKDGKATSIGIKAQGPSGDFTFMVNPVSADGKVITGAHGQNVYSSRALYETSGGAISEIYGEDVGRIRTYSDNLERILEGDLKVSDIESAYQKNRLYEDKNFAGKLSPKSNPEIAEFMNTTAMEDPGLALRPGKKATQETIRAIQIKDALENGSALSPSDLDRSVIQLSNNPITRNMPFLEETANPKSILRDVEYLDPATGKSSFRAGKETLFLDPDEMNSVRAVLEERGISLGELAEEQLIASAERSGKIVDKTRAINISEKGTSKHSEFLLNEIAKITGMESNKSVLSETLEATGLSGLTKDQQERIRRLSLDDYGNFLANRKAEIRENQNLLNKNLKAFRKQNNAVDIASAESELLRYEKELADINSQIKEKNFFGKKSDLLEDAVIKKNMKGLYLEDIHYDSGKISFQLRREKLLGAGDKIHEASGEIKSIIKHSVDNMEEILAEAYQRRTGNKATPAMREHFRTVDFLANKSAMKTELVSRNAFGTFYSALERAKIEGRTDLVNELEGFRKNYHSMPKDERAKIFQRIEQVTGQPAITYAGQNLGFGTKKRHLVAFGQAALDMGAGNLGSISERHLFNFQALGLKNFTKDVVGRRTNLDALKAAQDFSVAESLMMDKKYKGAINFGAKSKTEQEFLLKGLFSEITDSNIAENLESRRKALALEGKKGTAFIDLGMEIDGVSKIPVFQDDFYRGFIGTKIGASADRRRYSELDTATRNLLRGVSQGKDRKKLEQLMLGYKTAMDKMGGTLKDNLLKGKVHKSYYGLVTSAPSGLGDYAAQLADHYKTKEALPLVGVASKDKYIELFGREKYKEVMNMKGKKGLALSNTWAMITRDPVEGLSHFAMNVMPEGFFDGVQIKGSFAVVTDPDKKTGYHLLKSVFGDTDGDMFQVVAASTPESRKELQQLAYGNSPEAVAFRSAQKEKGLVSLKGKLSTMSFAESTADQRREAVILAKFLEKGEIGKISTELANIHRFSHADLANTGVYKKFFNLSNALHFMAENTIKGKHQTFKELREGKTLQIINALTGKEEMANASLLDRKKKVMGFFDELALNPILREGQEASVIADQMRKAAIDGKQLENMVGVTLDQMEQLRELQKTNWFKNVATDANIGNMFSYYEKGKEMKIPLLDALEFSVEEMDSDTFKNKIKFEKLTGAVEDTKEVALKGVKNLGKYALAPMAVIGIAGTLFGGTSNIEKSGERSYSDGAAKHDFGGHSQKPQFDPQMRRPKYERWSVSGSADQQSLNKGSLRNGDTATFVDNTTTLNKYEIQEMVERGY